MPFSVSCVLCPRSLPESRCPAPLRAVSTRPDSGPWPTSYPGPIARYRRIALLTCHSLGFPRRNEAIHRLDVSAHCSLLHRLNVELSNSNLYLVSRQTRLLARTRKCPSGSTSIWELVNGLWINRLPSQARAASSNEHDKRCINHFSTHVERFLQGRKLSPLSVYLTPQRRWPKILWVVGD